MKIEHRETLWKKRQFKTVEKGKGWKIQRPVEIKPLEELLEEYFKKKRYKWQ